MQETRKWIAKAESDKVQAGSITFFKGKVLAREDRNSEAREAFNQAKEADRSLAQTADYEIANTYVKERKIPEAKRSLQSVVAADPNSDLATFARDFEAALDKGLPQTRTWGFAVGAAYQYDDNVVLKPSSDIGLASVNQASGRRDSSIVSTFRVNYQPAMKGRWSFNGQYSLYSNTYFNTSDYNLLVQSLSLTPGYDLKSAALSLPLNYSYTMVRERGYSGVFSVKPTVQFTLQPGRTIQFAGGYGLRDMQEKVLQVEDRDASIYTLSAAYLHRFSNNEGLLRLKYEYSREYTDGANWDSRGSKVSVSILAPVSNRARVLLSSEAFFQRFININSFSGTGASGFPATASKRQDDVFNFIAGLIWDIKKNWSLNLQYLHITGNSNFPLYDYNRNVYTAGLEFRF